MRSCPRACPTRALADATYMCSVLDKCFQTLISGKGEKTHIQGHIIGPFILYFPCPIIYLHRNRAHVEPKPRSVTVIEQMVENDYPDPSYLENKFQ
jgi:hypothetical protein